MDRDDAERARDTFQGMGRKEQSQYVLDYLSLHSSVSSLGKRAYAFLIGTEVVCDKAWRKIIGIRKSRFYTLRALIEGKGQQLILL